MAFGPGTREPYQVWGYGRAMRSSVEKYKRLSASSIAEAHRKGYKPGQRGAGRMPQTRGTRNSLASVAAYAVSALEPNTHIGRCRHARPFTLRPHLRCPRDRLRRGRAVDRDHGPKERP